MSLLRRPGKRRHVADRLRAEGVNRPRRGQDRRAREESGEVRTAEGISNARSHRRCAQAPHRTLAAGLGRARRLASVQKADLPAVVTQMKQRFDREAPSRAKELWSAAYILMGLRYERAMAKALLRGVLNMKESVTYQAILEEGEVIGVAKGEAKGKAEEARKMLLLQGHDRFGEPSAKIVA